MTVRSIFERLQQNGPLSRADLTRETGISAPTVSKVVTELIDQGLVEETSVSENLLGRPGKRLSLATTRSRVLGVTIGADSTSVIAAALDGQIDMNHTRSFSSPQSYKAWLQELTGLVEQIRNSGSLQLLGIGICVPGLISRRGQVVLRTPSVPFLEQRSVSADLLSATGLRSVAVQQGQALAIAERLFGNARWLNDFVMLDVASGPAVGVYTDGEMLSGKNGLAGQFEPIRCDQSRGTSDHQRLPETDQQFVDAIARSTGRHCTLDDVWQEHSSGNLNVQRELGAFCKALAGHVAACVNLFDPATLFLHSKVLAFDPDLVPRLTRMAREISLAPSFEGCQVLPASVSLQDAAIAAIIDDLIRGLGPRLTSQNSSSLSRR